MILLCASASSASEASCPCALTLKRNGITYSGIKAQLGKVAVKRDNEFTSPLKSSSE